MGMFNMFVFISSCLSEWLIRYQMTFFVCCYVAQALGQQIFQKSPDPMEEHANDVLNAINNANRQGPASGKASVP